LRIAKKNEVFTLLQRKELPNQFGSSQTGNFHVFWLSNLRLLPGRPLEPHIGT
jgi:hypothetical protein